MTRTVDQLDKSGNLIKSWNSGREASNSLRIPFVSIAKAAAGYAKTAGGYVWKYSDQPEINNETWIKHPYLDIECSDFGRIRFNKRRITYGTKASDGYRLVIVKRKVYRVHRLIMEAFDPVGEIISEYADQKYRPAHVDHVDGNPANNLIDNLQWLTPSEHLSKTFRR